MVILFFSRLFYPHIGGVEKHVMEIGSRLVGKGFNVIVVTEGKDIRKKEIVNGISVFRIDAGKENRFKKFRIWLWLIKHINLIKQADIIHCHDVFFWYLPFRFLFHQKKVYTTFHGYEKYPVSKKEIFIRKLSEKLSKGNICIGDFIQKWYGTKADFVTYGGVPEIKIENKPDRKSALFIGRLDDNNSILKYAQAVRLLRNKIPGFALKIIGEGKYAEMLSGEFEVMKNTENAYKYYSKYNFAFVSGYLSMLEAMYIKRPVFAFFDNPLKEDYLKMSPFAKYAVIENSPEKISEEIIKYIQNEKFDKERTDKAHSWAIEQTWDKVLKLYLKLWKIDE